MRTEFDATVDFETPALEAELERCLAGHEPASGIALHVPASCATPAEVVSGDTELTHEINPEDWVIFTGVRDENIVTYFARKLREKL